MGFTLVGHVADPASWQGATLIAAAVAVLCVALVVENAIVRSGRVSLRDFRLPFAVVLSVALVATAAPRLGSAQTTDQPVGLPDLVSDPPFIWFVKDLDINDQAARVLAFDGYVHNIGTGSLDLFGNPQIEGGVKQRVFDGEQWNEVGTPTVRYETDDGHNHFHLIEAVDYSLWDEGRTSEIGESSKVGFCLIDTEQIETLSEAFYDIADTDYCGVDSPDATLLSMGITPGWRDTYDANTTLQWVDISNIRPANYWVAAVTDPNDEIVESNEENNSRVFSSNKFAVPGYVARTLPAQSAEEPIELLTSTFGTTGTRVFTIVEGPENGTLSVPGNVDLHSAVVEYTPDPGFVGEDSFRYSASDVTSGFPLEPVVAEVPIVIDEAREAPDSQASEPPPQIRPVADQAAQMFRTSQTQLELDDETAEVDGWFASGLPHGLTIDPDSGMISGIPTMGGSFTSTVVIATGAGTSTQTIAWEISPADIPTLEPVNDFSSSSSEVLRLNLGTGDSAARYEATGTPAGTRVVGNLPLLTGEPEEIGEFPIEVHEIIDDEIVDTIDFVWTVRPSIHPAFPL